MGWHRKRKLLPVAPTTITTFESAGIFGGYHEGDEMEKDCSCC